MKFAFFRRSFRPCFLYIMVAVKYHIIVILHCLLTPLTVAVLVWCNRFLWQRKSSDIWAALHFDFNFMLCWESFEHFYRAFALTLLNKFKVSSHKCIGSCFSFSIKLVWFVSFLPKFFIFMTSPAWKAVSTFSRHHPVVLLTFHWWSSALIIAITSWAKFTCHNLNCYVLYIISWHKDPKCFPSIVIPLLFLIWRNARNTYSDFPNKF